MAFNELLWSSHPRSIKKLIEERNCEEVIDLVPIGELPSTTQVFFEQFERVIKEYKYLKDYIDAPSGGANLSSLTKSGIYIEAFCNGISSILKDFNQILVSIEESFLGESSLTILGVTNMFDEYVDILKILSFAISEVQSVKYNGCKLVDLCENLIIKNPNINEGVFRKLKKQLLKPFFKQTKLWITQAFLYDPHLEYFITPVDKPVNFDYSLFSITTSRLAVSSEMGRAPVYHINANNLPSMIPLSVAMKILFIGEALTVCQNNESEFKGNERLLSICGISEQNIATQLSKIQDNEVFCLKEFNSLIDDLWEGVNKYIRQISDELGNVKDQLNLMWEMYLLGRGELFQEFLMKGSTLLNLDITLVDSRNLNVVFKDAVYYVYLTECSDLTDQFFFKLPNRKALRQGFTAWSVMQLKCKVRWPLHYLFTEDILNSYNRIFIFLLRLKKAQIDITSTWKCVNSVRNYGLRMELIEIRMHLLAVVGNLQNYCFTNVIASEMTVLQDSVKNASMFTDMQKALNIFLTNISIGLFLPDACVPEASALKGCLESLETVNKCFEQIFDVCRLFSEVALKNEENMSSKLPSLKLKLHRILQTLFSILSKIYEQSYLDAFGTTCHSYNVMMCVDYNIFFRSMFNLSPSKK